MRHQRRRPLPAGRARPRVRPRHRGLRRGDGGGGDSGTSNSIKDGGTLSYAVDQEPTGFNNNTSKDNGTSVLNVVINMFPPVFRLHPDYSVRAAQQGADGLGRADQHRPPDDRLQDQAGGGLVGRHPGERRRLRVSEDAGIANADNRRFFGEWLPQGNFDIANFGLVGNPFAISSSQDIYRTGGGGNYGQYQSDKVDQLFGQAVREVDEAKSAEIGNQIDQQLTADMATIPLYAKPTYLAVRNSFANVGDNATQEGPFWNSGLWAQKAT
jgi:hypothetical protein